MKVKRQIRLMTSAVLDNVKLARSDNKSKCDKIANGLLAKYIEPGIRENRRKMTDVLTKIKTSYLFVENELAQKKKILTVLNPENVLRQGYAIINGKVDIGNVVKITTMANEIDAEIKQIKERK